MEFTYSYPEKKGFFIYSKSGCKYCDIVKKIITDNYFSFSEINCDNYIINDKDKFLNFIEELIGSSYKTFPIVFYDGKFIGGSTHTTEFIKTLLLSFEENF